MTLRDLRDTLIKDGMGGVSVIGLIGCMEGKVLDLVLIGDRVGMTITELCSCVIDLDIEVFANGAVVGGFDIMDTGVKLC